MSNLIERYIYDVIRRLPEKERDEVSRELKANIYDMLSGSEDENEIKAVLYELGSPLSLANKYRQNPRYLISPAVYDDYIRVLKWVLPLIGLIFTVIGGIIALFESVNSGSAELSSAVSTFISKGIQTGFSGVFQALFWITFGFVIADRTGYSVKTNGGIIVISENNKDLSKKEWKIEDLPEILPNEKSRIPLSDSITGLVMTIAFTVVVILACKGFLPFAFMISHGDVQIKHLFSQDFILTLVPAVLIISLFCVAERIIKIRYRRWNPAVCGAVIIKNFVNVVILSGLIKRSYIFSTEFTAFLKDNEWGSHDLLRFMGNGIELPALKIITVIIVICGLAECASAIYKTVRTKK